MRSIHSSLFTENTIINYLVELTACWTIFMILSGTYLLIKQLISNKSKALRWQKWHAMIGYHCNSSICISFNWIAMVWFYGQ